MSIEDYERGRSEERHRIGAILSSDEARQHPQLAAQLAFKQSTPAAQAIGVLRASGKDDADANAKSWDALVDRQNADMGLLTGGLRTSGAADDPWDDVVSRGGR